MRILASLGIAILSVLSVHAEYWFDDFDRYTPGSIEGQGGWINNYSDVAVVSSGSSSAPNALSMPFAPTATTKEAVRGGLSVNCASKILRLSMQLFRDNCDQYLSVYLRDGTSSRLYISTDITDGTIKINGTDTGASFITGEFATLTLFYN